MEAMTIFDDREDLYGDFESAFARADDIQGTIGSEVMFSPPGSHSILAMIAVKLSRFHGDRVSDDTILDLLNYLAMFVALRRNFNARNDSATEAGA